MVGFILGLFLGGSLGIVIMSLIVMNNEERDELVSAQKKN